MSSGGIVVPAPRGIGVSIADNTSNGSDLNPNPVESNPDIPGPTEDVDTSINLMKNAIYPPPLMKETEAISNIADVNIPGEITVSPEGKLLRNIIVYKGFLGDLIQSYDHFIHEQIKQYIASQIIDLGDKTYIRVSAYQPLPMTSMPESEQITPLIARERSISYSAPIYAYFERRGPVKVVENGQEKVIDGVIEPAKRVLLGKIPIMLGSSLGWLHRKTERQKAQYGECSKDPLGYFIINGTEYHIVIVEKLVENRILTYIDNKGKLTCQMTSSTIEGTSKINIFAKDIAAKSADAVASSQIIKAQLTSMEKWKMEYLNIFQLYRLLGDIRIIDPNIPIEQNVPIGINLEKAQQYILSFTRQEWKTRVQVYLFPSVADAEQIGDIYERVADLLRIKDSTELRELVVVRDVFVMPALVAQIYLALFPQMDLEHPITALNGKLYLLSKMAATFVETWGGFKPINDRDSWANKTMANAGNTMFSLFRRVWKQQVNSMRSAVDECKNRCDLNFILRRIDDKKLTSEYERAFGTGVWVTKNNKAKDDGIVHSRLLERIGILALYVQMTRITKMFKAKGESKPEVRMVHNTQLGYVDPVETPESDQCGIVQAKAVTCLVTIDKDEAPIRSFIQPKIKANPTTEHTSLCVLNGRLIGWCAGHQLQKQLLIERRSIRIYEDTTIVFEEDDRLLYIYTDRGRPVRPLLIVDDDGELVIDKKKLWGSDFSTLLREGCVEYIGAWEQTKILVAQTVKDIRFQQMDLNEAIARRDDAQANLDRLREGSGLFTKEVLSESNEKDPYQENVDLGLFIFDDAEKELHQAQNVINKIRRRKRYTHCEVDPNAILGIAASLIPLPEHSMAPRNTYQCVHEDELVQMADGSLHAGQLAEPLRSRDQPITARPAHRRECVHA